MNQTIEGYIAYRKSEINKKKKTKQIAKLNELGIRNIVYSDSSSTSEEFPLYDYEKKLAFKVVDIGEFTDEEFEEAMKYAPQSQINKTKVLLAIYLIWVCVHFVLLFWGTEYWAPGIDDFFDIEYGVWPFCGDDLNDAYDLSEFVVYSVVPLIIYKIVMLLKGSKNN